MDGTGQAGRALGRAGNGTAHQQRKGTGFQRLVGLLRLVDVALLDDFGRALGGQLADEIKVDVVDAGGLGGCLLYTSRLMNVLFPVLIGVVGPVRTGKSTFIKRFMEQL